MARKPKPISIRIASEAETPNPFDEEVLARNLAAAFIATKLGIGLDYARKKYAHEPVGEFWISLARTVAEHLARYPVLPPRTPPTIQ